jgi:hypothetical protein
VTENKLHRSVAKTLNKILPQKVFWTSIEVSNGRGKNGRWHQQDLKARGVKTGFPDILIMWNDESLRGMCIELKWGYNKPTETQTKVHDELCKKLNIPTVVCRSIDEVLQALDVYEVPTIIGGNNEN